MVALLIESGADVDKQIKGWTPLHYAAAYNHVEIVKILLENRANRELRTMTGRRLFGNWISFQTYFFTDFTFQTRALDLAANPAIRELLQTYMISTESKSPPLSSSQSPTKHEFKVVSFTSPEWCHYCRKFIWGFAHQGVRCMLCRSVYHKYCKDLSSTCWSRNSLGASESPLSASSEEEELSVVASYLQELGLLKYLPQFEKEEIDGDAFMHLTDSHLEKMGLPIGKEMI